MPRGHTHDITHASANTGNTLGERSSVRQSKLYRLYESGNATKDLLGSGHLQWSTTRKQGVYEGHDIYDHNHPTNEIDACKYKTKNHQRSPMTTSTVTEKYTPAYNENLSDSFNQMSARARQGRFVSKQQQQAPENIKNLSPPRSKSYNHDVDFGDISSDQNLRDMARTKPSPNRNLYRARDIHRAGAEEVSSDLTANERVKAREAAVARLAATKGISSPPATHTTRAPQGIDVSQSLGRVASNDLYRERWGHGGKGSEPGLPSETREDESIYGPGGQEAFMDRLDHLDDDELGRLTKGLQHLKDMAVEAQRRDKLAKLRGELAQLEAYASPQSSPIYNKQSKSSPLLESGERTHVHFTKNSTGADSPKGILKNALRSSPNSQDRLVTINGSNLHDSYQKIHAECRPPYAQAGPAVNQSKVKQQTYLDSSKFYNTDFASVGKSHMHQVYTDPDGAEANVERKLTGEERKRHVYENLHSDPGQYYSTGSTEGFDRSHSHRSYQEFSPDKTRDARRRHNVASAAVKEGALPAHLRTKATNDALLKNEITPEQALRMTAPFATEASGASELHTNDLRADTESEGQIRTARSEAFRSTRPW